MKLRIPIGKGISSLKEHHVEVYVEVQTSTESLDKGDGSCLSPLFATEASLLNEISRNDSVHNRQYLAHDLRVFSKEEPELKGKAQNPLSQGFILGENFIHQMGCALDHTASPTAWAESTTLAAKGHLFFMLTGFTSNSQEAISQDPTTQKVFKLFLDEIRQAIFILAFHMLVKCE